MAGQGYQSREKLLSKVLGTRARGAAAITMRASVQCKAASQHTPTPSSSSVRPAQTRKGSKPPPPPFTTNTQVSSLERLLQLEPVDLQQVQPVAPEQPPTAVASSSSGGSSRSALRSLPEEVFNYFAFGANMSYHTLAQRDVRVLSRDPATVVDRDIRLLFKHRGGTVTPHHPFTRPSCSS